MKIHIYHHNDETNKKLDEILAYVKDIRQKEIRMSQELNDLELAVQENTDLDASIIQLVDGLAAQIEALKDDPAKMAALAVSLREKSALLAAAIQANTPVV